MIKWRDAYTSHKTTLKKVIKELGKVGICKTQGKIVYKNKHYIVLEQHTITNCHDGNDYFVIPKALCLKKV